MVHYSLVAPAIKLWFASTSYVDVITWQLMPGNGPLADRSAVGCKLVNGVNAVMSARCGQMWASLLVVAWLLPLVRERDCCPPGFGPIASLK
jgi:hypothetical protein